MTVYRLGEARRRSLLLLALVGFFLLALLAIYPQERLKNVLYNKPPRSTFETFLGSGVKSLSIHHLKALRNSTLGVRINQYR